MDLFSSIDLVVSPASSSSEPARKRIQELTALIDNYNYEYYMNDNSLVSDFEFDKLLRELIDLERQYPQFASPNSPTKRVGGDVNKSFRQVTHRFPMLSLGNTYSIEEIEEFESRTRKLLGDRPFSYTCELKYDGVAISLSYRHGQLVQAATRGNGVVGDDITSNARTIPTIPLRLRAPYPDDFEVRGEVVYPFAEFEAFNQQREIDGEEPFANPRNAASGSLKLQNSAECAKRKLRFCPYFIMLPPDQSNNSQFSILNSQFPNFNSQFSIFNSHFGRLQALASMGFDVQPYIRECRDINDIKFFIEYWDNERWNLPYAVDGIVIKVNEVALWDTLGVTSKSPRWAIAFKFKAKQVSTPLVDISFQVGRTGIITPVANLKPVWLGGTTVRRATLVNADFIQKMDIRNGDTLLVEKGGEIIPKIVGVDLAKRLPGAEPVQFITNCPQCGAALVRLPGEAAHYCPNSDLCPPQILGRLEHFVSRKAMNIDSLGTERLQMLLDKGLLRDAADLYDLTVSQLIGLESVDDTGLRKTSLQQKSAEAIVSAIDQSRKVPFQRVLFALGIPSVGEVAARKLALHFGDIDSLISASATDLSSVPDIGDKTASLIISFFDTPRHRTLVDRLRAAGLQFSISGEPRERTIKQLNNSTNPLSGLTFVVSGVFNTFSREAIKESILLHGGTVSSSLSGKTSYLLAGEKPGPEKIKKAQQLNIPILSESQYLAMISES